MIHGSTNSNQVVEDGRVYYEYSVKYAVNEYDIDTRKIHNSITDKLNLVIMDSETHIEDFVIHEGPMKYMTFKNFWTELKILLMYLTEDWRKSF